jgi:hypothetical protein
VLPQGSIAALAWAFAIVGWRCNIADPRTRLWWKWAGLAIAVITVALVPWHVSRLRDLHGTLTSESEAAHDLRILGSEDLNADAPGGNWTGVDSSSGRRPSEQSRPCFSGRG